MHTYIRTYIHIHTHTPSYSAQILPIPLTHPSLTLEGPLPHFCRAVSLDRVRGQCLDQRYPARVVAVVGHLFDALVEVVMVMIVVMAMVVMVVATVMVVVVMAIVDRGKVESRVQRNITE